MISLTEILINEIAHIEFGVMEVANHICDTLNFNPIKCNITLNMEKCRELAQTHLHEAIKYQRWGDINRELKIFDTKGKEKLQEILNSYVNTENKKYYPKVINLAPNLYSKLKKAEITEIMVCVDELERKNKKITGACYNIIFVCDWFLDDNTIEISWVSKEYLLKNYGEERECESWEEEEE